MKNKKNITKSESLFQKIYENEWNKLRNSETIFENSEVSLSIDSEYKKFLKSDEYQNFLHENDESTRIELIKSYFYKNTIFSLVESFDDRVTNEYGNMIPFSIEILLENTYDYIKKKGLSDEERVFVEILEEAYSIQFEKELEGLIEEGIVDDVASNTLRAARRSIKAIKDATFNTKKMLVLLYLNLVFGVQYMKNIFSNPNIYLFRLELNNKEIQNIMNTLIKSVKIENEVVSSFIKKYGNTTYEDIFKQCLKTCHMLPSAPTASGNYQIIQKLLDALTNNMNNMISSSFIRNNYMVFYELFFNKDEKVFSRYRMCVANNITSLLTGIARASFEVGDVSYNLIKASEEFASKNVDITKVNSIYKTFYNITIRSTADKVFKEAMLALISYEGTLLIIEDSIKARERKIVADDYYLKEDIKKIKFMIKDRVEEMLKDFKYKSYNSYKKYEENNRQNNEKKLAGNKPTKPKKDSLFVI